MSILTRNETVSQLVFQVLNKYMHSRKCLSARGICYSNNSKKRATTAYSFQYNLIRKLSKAQTKRDYYDVLGVSKSSTKDEIKKKFRELAKKYHPDLNKDDKSTEAKFREVSEAYEVLEDDKKRQMYDNFGHSDVDQGYNEQQQGGGFNPFGQGFGGFQSSFHSSGGHMDAEDMMEMFFGGVVNSRPVEVQVSLSFFEAVNGCKKEINFEYFTKDPRTRRKVRNSRKVAIDIPPGVDDGMSLRSPGNGKEAANRRPAEDLIISFRVNPDPYFERKKEDIHVNVAIPFTQAILGGSVDVLTIDGLVTVKIPQGAQPNMKFKLRGKGVKRIDNPAVRGNQIVNILVVIPNNLSQKQKDLISEFEKEEKAQQPSTANTDTKESGILKEAWNRLKDFLGNKK